MTPEEKHLWYDFFKHLPVTVKRQHNIENYIVDFYIAEKKLVIELDGEHHRLPETADQDDKRDADLGKWGITVLRFSNHRIRKDFSGVTFEILECLGLDFKDLRR